MTDVYLTFRSAPLEQVQQQVSWWEQAGGTGVLIPDHLFGAGRQGGSDPLILLAAIGVLSKRLKLGTSVSNVGFLHPGLVLRQFAQLSVLVGGDRVLAGLGAGWNRDEFEALGMRMPSFPTRIDRLKEAAKLARELFDHGSASLEGAHVVARNLPLAPKPDTPPRLFIGGGSERLLEIAGRYADVLDLNGTSQAGAVRGRNLAQADLQRRLSTTVAGLEASARRVQEIARTAHRPRVSISLLINYVVFCSEAERQHEADRIREAAGLASGSMDECPYVFI